MRGEKYGLGVMGAAAGKLRPLGGQREGYALSAGYDWLASVPGLFAVDDRSPPGAPLLLTAAGPVLWGELNTRSGSWFNLRGEDVVDRVDARGCPYIPEWRAHLIREGRPFELLSELFSVDTPAAPEG